MHQKKYKVYSFYLCNSTLQLKGYPDCRMWERLSHWSLFPVWLYWLMDRVITRVIFNIIRLLLDYTKKLKLKTFSLQLISVIVYSLMHNLLEKANPITDPILWFFTDFRNWKLWYPDKLPDQFRLKNLWELAIFLFSVPYSYNFS